MATSTDQLAGYFMVSVAVAVFIYYTVWVVVLPFVEPGHVVRSLFLPPAYALILPITAGVIVLIALGIFIAVITVKSKKKVKSS